ncbi:glycosyltransferase [Ignavibacterium sp.]|uniref:glycosyltransferase n=1 Tax=Ignavibacterium sp. TaxID=2651167 RepID=UPI00220CD981|nr:glycosyltransferase [Ignavibacterium sp.]BDQ04197.1 MAG: mannosyltransferase [Ignavibacterium sp.]
MQILQTNKAYYPKVGGIETTITTLSEGLVRDFNLKVDVLTCHHNVKISTRNEIINGVNVKYLPTYGFLHSLPLSPGYFFSLEKYSGDILHIHEPFPLSDISVLFNKKVKKNFKKIIVSWHSDIIRQKWSLVFYGKYILRFLELVDKIIVSNPALIKNSDFLKTFSEKCEVIPIGINLDWTKSANINSIKNEIPIILSVGRLVYYKGFEYLIDAMKDIQTAKLIIVGSGPLEKKLKNQIIDNNLSERIEIIPELDRDSLNSLFKSCDLFVLPSIRKSETFGIVQIEAMACGKPVVCTEIGTGTTFINLDGVTGLVVPPENSNALASAINKILSDDSLRNFLGNNAKQRALSEFNDNKMVSRVYELYKNLLENDL